jgi:hypothetical protein
MRHHGKRVSREITKKTKKEYFGVSVLRWGDADLRFQDLRFQRLRWEKLFLAPVKAVRRRLVPVPADFGR